MEGQGVRTARLPSVPSGFSLPSASMMPGLMPGSGLPMEPGRMSMQA